MLKCPSPKKLFVFFAQCLKLHPPPQKSKHKAFIWFILATLVLCADNVLLDCLWNGVVVLHNTYSGLE